MKKIYVKLTCPTCHATCIEEETDVCGPRLCINDNSIIEEEDASKEEFKAQGEVVKHCRWYN
jgi:hypothetical protein